MSLPPTRRCWEASRWSVVLTAMTIISLTSWPVRLPAQMRCRVCSLRYDTSFVLRSDLDSVFVEYPGSAVMDRAGNLVITSPRLATPAMFDSGGRFVRRVGHRGGGPGEFERATLLSVGPKGSIYVMDAGLARVSVVDADGAVRTSGVRGVLSPTAMVVLADGSIILSAFSTTDTVAPQPFVRIDMQTGGVRRFGERVQNFDVGRRGFRRFVLGPSATGGFWSVEVFDGTLRKYGPALTPTFIRPPPPWFPKGQVREAPSIGQDGRPPTTFVRAAVEDGQGRLWLVTSVPSRQWRRFAAESTEGIDRGSQPRMVSRLYESMIEILDASTGDLVYREIAPMMVTHALGDGKFLAYSDDQDIPSVAVIEIQVMKARGPN